jgi:diguanylate cyclase (GGDEF)-like protein
VSASASPQPGGVARAGVHLAAADAALLCADDPTAKAEAEAGLAILCGTDLRLEVKLLVALAAACGNLRLLDERSAASLKAVHLAQTIGDDLIIGQAAAFAALALAESGVSDDYGDAVSNLVVGSEALARVVRGSETLVSALVVLSHASLALGDLRSAAWFTDRAIATAKDDACGALGFALTAELRRVAREGLELERCARDASSTFERVVSLSDRAAEVSDELDDLASRLDAMLYRVLALGSLGRTAACCVALAELHVAAEAVGMPSWKAAYLGKARALIAGDRPADALLALDQAEREPVDDLLGEQSPWIHVERARAFTALEDHAAAAVELRSALTLERAIVAQLSDRLNDSVTARVQLKTAQREVVETRLEADRLADEAFRDSLTTLPNRRGLEAKVAEIHANRLSMTVGVIDIDRFKTINDTYGHQTGDRVLVEIAEAVTECCRPIDVVARLAGDEFVVALVDVESGAAAATFERIRAGVAARPWASITPGTAVTISVGWVGAMGSPWSDSLGAADEALYEAKQQGRNMVRGSGQQP